MDTRMRALLALPVIVAPLAAQEDPTTQGLRATVEWLARPEMKGRAVGSPEGRKTAEWIAERFAELDLEPAVGGEWFHEFTSGTVTGRNVAGTLRAADDKEQREYVVVGAHYDGLGVRRGQIRPGADDNASGVAVLLALAESLGPKRRELGCDIVFVAFDAEEVGLVGSRAFVQDDVIPGEGTRFALILDMVGGKLLPWLEREVFAMGSEHSPGVRALVEELRGDRPISIEPLGTYALEPAGPLLSRSDYQAYRGEGVPYLFLSTGTPWYYHTAEDTPDKIDFAKVREVLRFAHDLVLRVAAPGVELEFDPRPKPELRDLELLTEQIGGLLEHGEEVGLADRDRRRLVPLHGAMLKALESAAGPNRVRFFAHRVMIEVFKLAPRLRPR